MALPMDFAPHDFRGVVKCGDLYIPGTQMTLVLNGKGLLLEGSNPKKEDKQVPGIYIYKCGDLLVGGLTLVSLCFFGEKL